MTAPVPAIQLPDLLQGQWTSVLILTYGVDLDFLERRVLSQLPRVPLRVVLADGVRLAHQFADAARTGQSVRQANRSCLIGPIRHHRAAHAKAILLMSKSDGLLLVGSGNLGHDGYATSGEMWHAFAYQDDRREHLAEFVVLRDLVDGLRRDGKLDPPTSQMLDAVWGQVAWLPQPGSPLPEGVHPPTVRHNLVTPLIDQLAAAVAGDIETVTMYAPFHDVNCAAVSTVLDRFRPRTLQLLLTRDTSVDGERLAEVLAAAAPGATCHKLEVRDAPTTYVHAKWIHLVTADREIVLSGSANLSYSALLASAVDGNVELGIVTVRPRGGFNDLYAPLTLSEIDSPTDLGVTYDSNPDEVDDPTEVALSWSRLDGNVLTLVFDRLDGEVTLTLTSGGATLDVARVDRDAVTLTAVLSPDGAARVAAGGPVHVILGGAHILDCVTWPYQLVTLKGRLERSANREVLATTGTIPDDEAELLQLLRELDGTLIFDTVTAWRVASAGAAADARDDDENSLRWEDLDWDRIRRDPRYGAYRPGATQGILDRTDVEVIMASIAGRLGALGVEAGDDLAIPGDTSTADDADGGATDEEDGDDEDAAARRIAVTVRVRMAFNRFIRRYTAATIDRGFIDELGLMLTIYNAAIFNHLLHQLLVKEAADLEATVTAQLATWEMLWGNGSGSAGLLADMEGDERVAATNILDDARTRTTVLRAVAQLAERELSDDLRRRLRLVVRRLIVNDLFDLETDIAARPDAESAQTVAQLTALANLMGMTGGNEVAEYVLASLSTTRSEVDWRNDVVKRLDGTTGKRATRRTTTLVVRGKVDDLTIETVKAALARFVAATNFSDPGRDYWRIQFEGNKGWVGFWDATAGLGSVFTDTDEDEDFASLTPHWPDWVVRLKAIETRLKPALSA